MLIPKKIKIGKQYYYVRVEPTHRAAQLGYVQYGNRLIVINDVDSSFLGYQTHGGHISLQHGRLRQCR